MKKLLKRLSLVLTLVLVATASINAQEIERQICSEKITVVINNAMIEDDVVVVDCDFIIPTGTIDDCSSLNFVPYISSEDGEKSVDLQTLTVNGVKKHAADCSVYYGFCNTKTTTEYKVENDPTVDQVVSYAVSVNLRDWMLPTSKLMVRTSLCHTPCGVDKLGDDFLCNIPFVTEPLEIAPVWAPVALDEHGRVVGPEYDDTEASIYVKDKTLKYHNAKIYFPVNVTRSVEKYLENADALALLKTLDQENYQVEAIEINGWASPESTVKYNQSLSEKRAATMQKIIAANYSFPEEIYTTTGKGEYWEGVKNAVATSQSSAIAENREALQAVIDSDADLDKKEAELKKIARRAPYNELFKEVYPRSRFTDAVISYRVKQYTPEEVLVVMYERPEHICVGEYYRTLLTLEKCGEKYLEVLGIALEVYPDCPELNYLAGECAYNAGEYEDAEDYLKNATSIVEAVNDLGCAKVKLNEPEAAERNFKKAEKKGVEEATENLEVVKKLKFNNKYFAGEDY